MTKFLFVRHGEPDYPGTLDWQKMPLPKNFAALTEAGRQQIKNACEGLKQYSPELIVSSPFTRTLQGAAIMAKELNLDVMVEHDLYEWQADLTYLIEDDTVLDAMVQDYFDCDGICPNGETRLWETTEAVRSRVLGALKKYREYSCVIVSAHGLMTQAAFGYKVPLKYGEFAAIDLEL